VLLADSSKYGKNKLFSVAKLNDFDIIITDSNLSQKEQDKIVSLGVKLIIA